MGGDGGVIASNRRYLRGAGTADKGGDRRKQQESIENKNALATCHVSQQPLNYSLPIVSCPYGRLYQKEAAVEALLRRTSNSSCSDTLGSHIRGLKDLYEVRFHLTNNKPTCPVTGVELNDKHPAFLIRNTSSSINVLSERARKEVGMEVLQSEYGPFDESEDILRLAPNVEMLQEMQEKLKEKRMEKSTKKSKKDGKKRKKLESSGGELSKKKKQKQGVAEAARARVATAVASNPTLSSLFASDKKSGVSEKEKNDNLFART